MGVYTGAKVLFLTLLSALITTSACLMALTAKVIGLTDALAIPPSIGVATAAILVEAELTEENIAADIKKWVSQHKPVFPSQHSRIEHETLPLETGPLPSPAEFADIVTPQLAEIA